MSALTFNMIKLRTALFRPRCYRHRMRSGCTDFTSHHYQKPFSSHGSNAKPGPASRRNARGNQTGSTPYSKSMAERTLRLLTRPLTRFFQWYARQQQARPYITQLCSTPLIFCLGDYAAQLAGGSVYDPHRSASSLLIGAAISIPTYEWFMFLGRHFNYPSMLASTAVKVVANQFLYTPAFNVYFFASHALLSGESFAGIVERVMNTATTSIPRSFLFWPFVTAVNFTYVQPQFRAVVTGIFSVFWQTYLSWLNNKAQQVRSDE